MVMASASPAQFRRFDTVPPSLTRPDFSLKSRTPIHLIHISSAKLNDQIYSSRSLSIERRILLKNFLTFLYQLQPLEWNEESSVDSQDHWAENTHSAVSIDHSDFEQEYNYDHDCSSSSSREEFFEDAATTFGLDWADEPILSPSAAAAASVVTSRRRPQFLRSSHVPLPRPVSMELPIALQSYLSTVFDVDWSVGLSTKEDSLFTFKPAQQSPLRSTLPPSSLVSSISEAADDESSRLHQQFSSQNPPAAGDRQRLQSHSQPILNNRNVSSGTNYSKAEYDESQSNLVHQYNQQQPIRKDNYTQQNLARSASEKNFPSQSASQTHIHNHIHIHIHNYSPENQQSSQHIGSSSPRLSHSAPIVRSARYPKPESYHGYQYQVEPMTVPQTVGSGSLPHLSDFPAPPETPPHTGLVAMSVASTHAPVSLSLPSSSSSGVYPPEKTEAFVSGVDEEQPYLAVAPSASSLCMHSSLPPPPYTQLSGDETSSVYGGLATCSRITKSDPIPIVQSPLLAPSRPQPPPSLPISTSLSSSDNQKLIEYQQYEERKKMFLQENNNKENGRSSDGLGFIKQLFKHGSKKKTQSMAVISAPLPATSSLLLGSKTPFLLQDLIKQDLMKQMSSLPRSKAG